MQVGDGKLIYKPHPSSDWSLQPDSMKVESLVIAHQPWRGEYVPGPCTHRPSSHGSCGDLKAVPFRRAVPEGAAGIPPYRVEQVQFTRTLHAYLTISIKIQITKKIT